MDMRRYKIVDVPESRLEHLVQQGADLIEDGLKYLDQYKYITDKGVRKQVEALLEEVKAWDSERTTIDATKYDLSLKVNNRVFAYLTPRRKHFLIYMVTTQADGHWQPAPA
jgi:hypothetical protein